MKTITPRNLLRSLPVLAIASRLLIQLQDVTYFGGAGFLGNVCEG